MPLHVFLGNGKPLISAVDARSFLRRNGHGLRPPSRENYGNALPSLRSRFTFEKVTRETAAQRRPARSERNTAFFHETTGRMV